MDWIEIGSLDDIPPRGARTVESHLGQIAVFRTAKDEVFALINKCPHSGGPLSEGIVSGRKVTCPLHNWVIDLGTGEADGPDEGCTNVIPVRQEGRRLLLGLDAHRKAAVA
ncbi:nitrite reductase small subunit NirD [Telmatospirillum sp. J64-1]|uniref:nitrite reductase small subunit NirD n=1 Tax=Telmatospirillum sp. J64-1 TaxID=2502183 RepID=UPI00351ABCBF